MAEYTVDFKMTHSQTLLPMIDENVKLVGIDLNTIDAIAVSGGPGFLYGTQDRLCDCEGTWTGIK